MPNIRAARSATDDLVKSAQRANAAWSKSQMVDALRSVRYWLEQAEKAIEDADEKPHIPQPQGKTTC
jgi:hypothetical protein